MRLSSKFMLAAAVAALPLVGCATAEKASTQVQGAVQAQTTPTLSTTDSTFFDNASRSGIEEVTFSQLARQQATRSSTRAFAVKMVDGHTTVNQQLTQLAMTKGITPPTTMDTTHQAAYDALGKLHGRAFDRTYLNGQATDHAATLQVFQNEAQNGTDPEVKAFAARIAPEIQSHLNMAEKLGGHPAAS